MTTERYAESKELKIEMRDALGPTMAARRIRYADKIPYNGCVGELKLEVGEQDREHNFCVNVVETLSAE